MQLFDRRPCRVVGVASSGRRFFDRIQYQARTAVLSGRVAEMTANQGYQLTVPTPAEALQTVLVQTAKSVTARNGHIDILYADRDQANAAIDTLRAAGHPIEALTATRSTLEQIFMETVQ